MGAGVKIKSMAPVAEWIAIARQATVIRPRASVGERVMMGRLVRRVGTGQTVKLNAMTENGVRTAVLTVATALIRLCHLKSVCRAYVKKGDITMSMYY